MLEQSTVSVAPETYKIFERFLAKLNKCLSLLKQDPKLMEAVV